LSKERKIPASVAAALKVLNNTIGDCNATATAATTTTKTVDEELVALVKEFGLARDISKYDTTLLDACLAKYSL